MPESTERATHTPGEWTPAPCGDGRSWVVMAYPYGGGEIAHCNDMDDPEGAPCEAEANARLAAAAPDLLDALRDVLDTTGEPKRGAYRKDALAARARAVEAIHKATGGAK